MSLEGFFIHKRTHTHTQIYIYIYNFMEKKKGFSTGLPNTAVIPE